MARPFLKGSTRPGALALMLVALLAWTMPAAAIDADEMLANPEFEAKAREIGKGLRCLVCQNQSIFDSNASLARDLRVLVRERVEAGDDSQAVKDYVVARFGDFVLLQPPVKPLTYALWVTPALLILAALFIGHLYMRRQKLRTAAAAPALSSKDRAEARRLLKGEGR